MARFEKPSRLFAIMEDQLRGASRSGAIETVALRFGGFYGPGVPYDGGASRVSIRAGRLFAPRAEGQCSPSFTSNDAVSADRRGASKPSTPIPSTTSSTTSPSPCARVPLRSPRSAFRGRAAADGPLARFSARRSRRS